MRPRLGLYRRELSGVEGEVLAPREVGSARVRKSTELQVMAGFPGSIFGLAGELGQVILPLPHLPWLTGGPKAIMHGKVMIMLGAVRM